MLFCGFRINSIILSAAVQQHTCSYKSIGKRWNCPPYKPDASSCYPESEQWTENRKRWTVSSALCRIVHWVNGSLPLTEKISRVAPFCPCFNAPRPPQCPVRPPAKTHLLNRTPQKSENRRPRTGIIMEVSTGNAQLLMPSQILFNHYRLHVERFRPPLMVPNKNNHHEAHSHLQPLVIIQNDSLLRWGAFLRQMFITY